MSGDVEVTDEDSGETLDESVAEIVVDSATKDATSEQPQGSLKKSAVAQKAATAKKSATAKKPTVPKKPTAPKKSDTKKPAAAKKPAAVKKPAAAKKPDTAKKPAAVKKPAAKTTTAAKKKVDASREATEDKAPTAIEERAPKRPSNPAPDPITAKTVLSISGLTKRFGQKTAVAGISLDVLEGSFFGIVGPNGAGKTTTLSMVTGLLRPDAGTVTVHDIDMWREPERAKRTIGVLPDQLRLFDRLTGAQLLYYAGALRGLSKAEIAKRSSDLAEAFGIEDALGRLVVDYSAGMTKKVALASAMIHSPRLLVLDEPFESVDPVSTANVIEILKSYVSQGGTVVLSSHGMDLIERVCDSVAVIVNGLVLAAGSVDEVRGDGTLEDRFVELAGGRKSVGDIEWLHSFLD